LSNLVIAIDGPASSGKTTTARGIAQKLGYLHIDTGAMYRAMTLKVLESKFDMKDMSGIARLAESTHIEETNRDGQVCVFLDGKDVTDRLRSREITNAVSAVSAIKEVRDVMVREQRRMGEKGGVVLEGRDIGTVVFPDADVKVFMVADLTERTRRRQHEMSGQNTSVDLETLRNEIKRRDEWDSGRQLSPLKQADDAILLDTSHLTIDEQIEFVVKLAQDKLKRRN
jgi:cytidylate kinase